MNEEIRHTLPSVHPGTILGNELVERAYRRFAIDAGINREQLDMLLRGEASMTEELASKIATALGTEAKVWMNLQRLYNDENQN